MGPQNSKRGCPLYLAGTPRKFPEPWVPLVFGMPFVFGLPLIFGPPPCIFFEIVDAFFFGTFPFVLFFVVVVVVFPLARHTNHR